MTSWDHLNKSHQRKKWNSCSGILRCDPAHVIYLRISSLLQLKIKLLVSCRSECFCSPVRHPLLKPSSSIMCRQNNLTLITTSEPEPVCVLSSDPVTVSLAVSFTALYLASLRPPDVTLSLNQELHHKQQTSEWIKDCSSLTDLQPVIMQTHTTVSSSTAVFYWIYWTVDPQLLKFLLKILGGKVRSCYLMSVMLM